MLRYNPYRAIPYDDATQPEITDRLSRGIQRMHATIDLDTRMPYAGYPNGVSYRHPPLNRFQERVRKGVEEDEDATYHYTKKFSSRVVER
jgi:hypothetical protein